VVEVIVLKLQALLQRNRAYLETREAELIEHTSRVATWDGLPEGFVTLRDDLVVSLNLLEKNPVENDAYLNEEKNLKSIAAEIDKLRVEVREKDVLVGAREMPKKNIMVVDDNPDIVTIVKTLLEVKGYEVQSAYSGQEFFNLIAEQKPDLILLDIMMPRMDGLEVLTRLKGDSNTRSIPVVLLTAKQPDEAIFGGYDIWADSYITKPFTNTQLLNVINRLIGEA